jgi:hypothetical protein
LISERRPSSRGAIAEAVDTAAHAESPLVHGDALMDLAEVLTGAENTAQAERAASHALSLYERKGDLVSSRRARALIQADDG